MSLLPDNLFAWVLAPYVQTNDVNLDYYYDFTQSIQEYTDAFAELGVPWKWQQVTNRTYRKVIEAIKKDSFDKNVIVVNLCDGDEINRAPGLNVIRYLKKKELCFTGAREYFYKVTTSKIAMKEIFELEKIPTAPWRIITEENVNDPSLFYDLGQHAIIKPAISGGSLGVNIQSVVTDNLQLAKQYAKLQEGYHGWKIANGGVIAERFIKGPEFTTLIVGDAAHPADCKIYTPVERVFHKSLPAVEKFLSFDRLWEMYEEETPIRNNEDFYNYHFPPEDLIERISKISFDAYKAVRGKGYCRVDLRMDAETRELFVLEVNSQCGLSNDENFTSIGAILRLTGNSFASLVSKIMLESVSRKSMLNRQPSHQLQLI